MLLRDFTPTTPVSRPLPLCTRCSQPVLWERAIRVDEADLYGMGFCPACCDALICDWGMTTNEHRTFYVGSVTKFRGAAVIVLDQLDAIHAVTGEAMVRVMVLTPGRKPGTGEVLHCRGTSLRIGYGGRDTDEAGYPASLATAE